MYDAGMGMIIFAPVAILSWFPFVSTFQSRLLFNQAFSRGLEISKILAGNKANVQLWRRESKVMLALCWEASQVSFLGAEVWRGSLEWERGIDILCDILCEKALDMISGRALVNGYCKLRIWACFSLIFVATSSALVFSWL